MLKKKAVWLLILLLAGQIMLVAEEMQPGKIQPSPKDSLRKALEKSLVFPGLGQLAEKQYVKAAVFASAEILCLVQIFIFRSKGNDAYEQYRAAVDFEAVVEFRRQTEKYDKRRNTAILAAAGVWVLNMIDIFVFAKKKYGKKLSVGFQPYYDHENKTIGVSMRFSPL